MNGRILSLIACLSVMMLSGCIPLSQYTALESEMEDQRTQAKKKIEILEDELRQSGEMLQKAEAQGRDCCKLNANCYKDLNELQAQHDILKNINLQLSTNTKKLQQDLQQKKSVIQLQEKVIRLLDDTKKTIETSLKDQIAAQDIEVVEVEDKLKLVFVDKILFDSGSAEINSTGETLLQLVAASLKENKNHWIVVEGHTDDVPLSPALKKRFPSNWELSSARAVAVVRFLQEKGGLSPERLAVHGYSFYRPVATNKTPEGRRQNRRIEIILSPLR